MTPLGGVFIFMKKTKNIVFISIYVALALVLDFIKAFIPFLNMPSGGSINIALIPIVVCSFHLGIKNGITCGFAWWLLSSVIGLNNYFLNIPQYIVDYILPSIIPGMCCFLYKDKKLISMELGIVFCMLFRMFCLVISGAIFWPGDAAANSLAAWSFSLAYNVPYSLATTVLLMFVTPLIIKSLRRYVV